MWWVIKFRDSFLVLFYIQRYGQDVKEVFTVKQSFDKKTETTFS